MTPPSTPSWIQRAPFLASVINVKGREEQTLVEAPDGILTYSQASRLAYALATHLTQECGVSEGDRVLISDTPSVWFPVAIAAVQLMGGIPIPMNSTLPPAHIQAIAHDCAPRLALVNADETQLGPVPTISLRTGVLGPAVKKAPQFPATASSPALIMYTTGSTGRPKGVVIPYSAHISATESLVEYLQYPRGSRILVATPGSFDYGLYQYVLAMHARGTAVVAPRPVLPLDLFSGIIENRIDVLPLVPTQWRALVHLGDAVNNTILERIQVGTSTGSPIDNKLMRNIKRIIPSARFFSMYGLTECKRVSFLAPQLALTKPESVGRPMPNCAVRIVDENDVPVEPGQVGELLVRGPSIAYGYWNDSADVSGSVFCRDNQTGEALLRTGDLFRQDSDGDLYFVGRRDDIVKVHDMRVSLIEVDQFLNSLPGVIDAISFVRSTPEGPSLGAQAVADRELSLTALRREMRSAGCPNHMLPSELFVVDSIPRSANGKPLRPRLAGVVVSGSEGEDNAG